jgi:hypothetical protein
MNGERRLEQEILASFERGEWKPPRNQKGEIARLRVAAEEGVPYQTLMASVLHKFVAGRLVETQRRIAARSSRAARKRAAA